MRDIKIRWTFLVSFIVFSVVVRFCISNENGKTNKYYEQIPNHFTSNVETHSKNFKHKNAKMYLEIPVFFVNVILSKTHI